MRNIVPLALLAVNAGVCCFVLPVAFDTWTLSFQEQALFTGSFASLYIMQVGVLLFSGVLMGLQTLLIPFLTHRWIASMVITVVAGIAFFAGVFIAVGNYFYSAQMIPAILVYVGCTWTQLALPYGDEAMERARAKLHAHWYGRSTT